jgi:hypothetical protein
MAAVDNGHLVDLRKQVCDGHGLPIEEMPSTHHNPTT